MFKADKLTDLEAKSVKFSSTTLEPISTLSTPKPPQARKQRWCQTKHLLRYQHLVLRHRRRV